MQQTKTNTTVQFSPSYGHEEGVNAAITAGNAVVYPSLWITIIAIHLFNVAEFGCVALGRAWGL